MLRNPTQPTDLYTGCRQRGGRNPVVTRLSVLGIASAVALATAVAFAQQAAAPPADQQPQSRPTFKTGTNYVRVDAFATKGGTPVTDLRADDFELLEDGV